MLAANVGLGRWGTVLADDRLVEFGGPGGRPGEPPMPGKSGSQRRARAENRKTSVAKPERKSRSFPKGKLD